MNRIIFYGFLSLLILNLFLGIKCRNSPKVNKTKILGFQVCGTGNGHLTQAKTVYDILIKYYHIPVVIVYGRNYIQENLFSKSKLFYQKQHSNTNSIAKMDRYKAFLDLFSNKNTKYYENNYGVNLWFNFLVLDVFNFRTKQVQIANQILLPYLDVQLVSVFLKLFSYTHFTSMIYKNKFSNAVIPSLINIDKLDRSEIDDNLILCYSVSNYNFPKTLFKIAEKYPNHTFHYFLNYNLEMQIPKNVILHKQSKKEFKEYLSKTSAVLCTSGNQLCQECIYHNIPLAIMPCDKKHSEQVYNITKYCKKIKFAVKMHNNLDINTLKMINNEQISKQFKKSFKNRDQKILDLCNI